MPPANFLAVAVSLPSRHDDSWSGALHSTLRECMKDNLYPELAILLERSRRELPAGQSGGHHDNQPFDVYRHRRRPARQTAWRRAMCISRVGELTAAQNAIVTATAEFLAPFFDLPVYRGADLDPATFPSDSIRMHPQRGQPQLLTDHIINEAMREGRPDDALIYLAVTAADLWSTDNCEGPYPSVFGEAYSGHAGVWSLRYLGNAGHGEELNKGCLRRSCIVAAHEGLHVLGLDHCGGLPCLMTGASALSGPLQLCPGCLRKLCWNRQLDLQSYLCRLRDFLTRWGFAAETEQLDDLIHAT